MLRMRDVILAGVSLISLASPALAQDSGEESAGGDIIVTARRTEERLQDVPISITVFNQQQLSNRNVVTATDLATYTPSLTVNQRFGPEKSSFTIRGFIQENSTAPSVGVYFADVVSPRAAGGTTSGGTAAVGSFMDLQNVQVLKGPQGTLFGRNTTGGAVLLVPTRPTDRLEGWVEGSAGDYNMLRAQAVLNVPLADTFKVRVAVDRNKRDGYMKNHSGIGPDTYNDINYFAGRLSILADLTPELENYTIATYSNSFSNGYGARMIACNPNLTNLNGLSASQPNGNGTGTTPASPVLLLTSASGCDQIARQNARGDGPLDVDIDNKNAALKLRQWQFTNTTTWRINDNLTVKNIVSYAEFREKNYLSLNGDNFFVPNNPPSFAPLGIPVPLTPGTKYQYIWLNPSKGENQAAQSAFTEELQFQGVTDDGRLTWQAGGYIELSRPLGWSAGSTGILYDCVSPEELNCVNRIFIGSISRSSVKTEYDTYALYAQATYKLTDQLSFTGGFRYTWDTTRAIARNARLRVPSALQCNDPLRFPGTTPGQGAVVTNQNQCLYEYPDAKSKRPTWLIDVDYKPIDDLLLYAKYARGYRMGGINPTNVGLETWGPEKVDAYEIGAKYSFGGVVPGYFNVAGFYNDFTDQQLNANATAIPGSGFGGAQPVVNAGSSRIQGFEVDSSVTLFDQLRIDAGYTYLDTRLKSYSPPPIPAGAPYNALIGTAVVGGPLGLSPKHRLTLSATYTLPLDEKVGKISFGATYVYTSDQFATRADDQYVNYLNGSTPPGQIPFRTVNFPLWSANLGHLPATNIVNLNVNWDDMLGMPVDAAFFVTNITNEIYPVAVGGSLASAGMENVVYAAPRMWGFRLKYRFGD